MVGDLAAGDQDPHACGRYKRAETRSEDLPDGTRVFPLAIIVLYSEHIVASQDPFGSMLRRRREALGLSIRAAARQIGISPSYLVALESGRNPSTGRAPTPSVPILSAAARTLELDMGSLLALLGAPQTDSGHLLLYQTGPARQSALDAARIVLGDRISTWFEIVDPRTTSELTAPDDVVLRAEGPLGLVGSGRPGWRTQSALTSLADLLGKASRLAGQPQLGLVFGAHSNALRAVGNPTALLDAEATWEQDVAAVCRDVLGVIPAATVCVYREADIQELAPELNPLTAAMALLQTHPAVAVQDRHGSVVTGPAATESVLAAARPAGTSTETWKAVAQAASIGLATGNGSRLSQRLT